MRDAVSALARQDYAAARAPPSTTPGKALRATASSAAKQPSVTSTASINAEQERAARDEARREQERSERERVHPARKRARRRARITADAERRAPRLFAPVRHHLPVAQLQSPGPVCFKLPP